MCGVGQFAHDMREIENEARDRALREGKSYEEAQQIGEKARLDSGLSVITALGKSSSWAITGAAVGSVVPVVGTAVGGTIGFVAGALKALTDPNPSPAKAVGSYVSMFRSFINHPFDK